MRVFDSTQLNKVQKGGVVSIGNFDGVHLGHQAILRTAREKYPNAELSVMTFEPHPAVILHPEKMSGVLSPLPMKARLLEQFGVEQLIVITDSIKLLNLSPKEFVEEFLGKTLAPAAVIEGPNFNFGYGRSGTLESLRVFGRKGGFDVCEVPYRQIHLASDRRSVNCSSSLIRKLLEEGQVCDAATALGRPYRLVGKTVAGRGIGRQLGFPTANIQPEKQIIPSEGVYAGYVIVGQTLEEVCVGGFRRHAVFSLGRAKTFMADYPLLIEAHILEPKVEDLYGRYLAMDFVERIRGQQRFDGQAALVEQIHKDCEKTLDILKKNKDNTQQI
jgi:riboflavin kinase / FMN adenylyltransferase